MDDVASSDPDLSLPQLHDVPDDQYLCFWAECLAFEDTEAVRLNDVDQVPAGTRFFPSHNAIFMISELFRLDEQSEDNVPRHILGPMPERGGRMLIDASSHAVVGRIAPCRWRVDSGKVELVLMAHENIGKKPDAVVLEVERRHGVAYRRSIGVIRKQEWARSRPITRVVVLN